MENFIKELGRAKEMVETGKKEVREGNSIFQERPHLFIGSSFNAFDAPLYFILSQIYRRYPKSEWCNLRWSGHVSTPEPWINAVLNFGYYQQTAQKESEHFYNQYIMTEFEKRLASGEYDKETLAKEILENLERGDFVFESENYGNNTGKDFLQKTDEPEPTTQEDLGKEAEVLFKDHADLRKRISSELFGIEPKIKRKKNSIFNLDEDIVSIYDDIKDLRKYGLKENVDEMSLELEQTRYRDDTNKIRERVLDLATKYIKFLEE